MSLPKFKKYQFVFDFFQTREQYPFYSQLINSTNAQPTPNKSLLVFDKLQGTIHVVKLIPPFLQPQFRAEFTDHYTALSFQEFQGFMADFQGFSSFEQYLQEQMNSKMRKKLRSYVRKLESCFNITYTLHLGEISKDHYDFLFSKAHTFISRRFQQRGDTHKLEENWDFIERTAYDLIRSRKASLFVIYRNKEPLSICLNYHFENIIYNAMAAYDIDYYKFSLGSIDIFKQMEWCVTNKIRIFNLGLGYMPYKTWWCNVKYTFENQVLYDRQSPLQKAMAYAYVKLFKLRQYFRKINLDQPYHYLKSKIKVKSAAKSDLGEPEFEFIDLNDQPALENAKILDIRQPELGYLRKSIFEFQFRHSESENDIQVYEDLNRKNVFYIFGKRKLLELRLLNNSRY